MHEVPDEEENAAELNFGKNFFHNNSKHNNNIDDKCLTIDEVCLFMKKNTGAATEYVI